MVALASLRALLVAAAVVATAETAGRRGEGVAVENVLIDVNAASGEWCCAAALQPGFGVAARATGLWPQECVWMEMLFDGEGHPTHGLRVEG